MKKNNILMVIIVAAIVFSGTTFEVKAVNWKDYVPDVPALINRFINALSDYKNRFLTVITYGSEEAKYLVQHKAVIMGTVSYERMLDRMKNLVNDSHPQEICFFMQLFVQNYVNTDDQVKNIVKEEHDIFNDRLQQLRAAGVPWSTIGCLTQQDNSQTFLNTWAFFNHLKKFDPIWSEDETLKTAISRIESMIVKD